MPMPEELSRTPVLQSPPPDTSSLDDAPRKANRAPSSKPTREAPQALSDASMTLGRAGTLSWQQRRSSPGSAGTVSQPVSVAATDASPLQPQREGEYKARVDDSVTSRSQIAQSLGSKDPTWFKQTQDRGSGSAAYRRNQDEFLDDQPKSGSISLPGMSRESVTKSESRMDTSLDSVRSGSPFSEVSIQSISREGYHHSKSAYVSSVVASKSPLPTRENQRIETPLSDTTSSFDGESSSVGRPLAMSPAQGRISPERPDRPTSPTKGLGGFVQSAMMKRSDSVIKRWSAQAGPGLSRGNSTVSNTSGYGTTKYPRGGITPLAESRPNSISRENSPAAKSRPGSSHSNATVTWGRDGSERPASSTSLVSTKLEIAPDNKPSTLNAQEKSSTPANDTMSPPTSPSKRWSPSKASWLENAINRPDSPKVKMPAPQQPAWMADIVRAKQHRGSVDLSKDGKVKEVSVGGQVPSPPFGAGYTPPSISGLTPSSRAVLIAKPGMGASEDTIQKNHPSAPETGSTNSESSSPSQIRSRAQFDGGLRLIEVQEPSVSAEETTESVAEEKATFRAGLRVTSPPTTKVKPETPPKKDFKSTSKPRPNGAEVKDKDEPEFKNIFGKLKRTQTQNYVAPDELKDNIMRGKAGLIQTGGPNKTERKDEFKESILQKKQKMVAPSASTRITSASSKIVGQTTPEAIVKRNGLTRSDHSMSNGNNHPENQPTKLEALAKIQHMRDKPKPEYQETHQCTSVGSNMDARSKGALGGNFTSSLAGILERRPSPMASKPNVTSASDEIVGNASISTANSEPSSTGQPLTHVTKARAKGPKRRPPTLSNPVESVERKLSTAAFSPKQRLNENQSFNASSTTTPRPPPSTPSKFESRPLSNITNNNNNNRKTVQPSSPRKPSTSIASTDDLKPASPIPQSPSKDLQIRRSPVVTQKPVISPTIDKRPIRVSSTPDTPPSTAVKGPGLEKPSPSAHQLTSAQQEQDFVLMGDEKSIPSVKGDTTSWDQSLKPTKPPETMSPVKLPICKDAEPASEQARLRPKQIAVLGIKTSANSSDSQQSRIVTPPATKSPRSPPLPGKKPAAITSRAGSITLLPTKTAQTKQPSPSKPLDVLGLLANIFDEAPNSRTRKHIDAQSAVNPRAADEKSQKIKTLRKQIFEVTGNGRSVPVPSQQEHILFEESLYLCTHIFGSPSGQRTTEVYLWCGDGVSASTVDDAQIFAKKVAKDSNGKLIIFKQGKETANFFQALGGIVITRRGSSRQATSLASSGAGYMLCGRQHVGQIAFDEVDFTPRSLCRGFPYIVSTPSGKLYLWKGTGSDADELGCARLIGMDLGLTGEIEEIVDGQEPEAFWKALAEGKRDMNTSVGTTAQHWHLKPSCENYITRLFVIDSEASRPRSSTGFMAWGRRGSAPSNDASAALATQMREVMPFAQSDLLDDAVFVLDAFFELFMYVSSPLPIG